MKRTLIAAGLLIVIGLLLVVTLRAAAAPELVRVIQAQVVEQMFDASGQEVVAQPGKQFVMVEVAGLVHADELMLNGVAPMAVVGNRFVFEIEADADDMTFVYRPSGGGTW